MKLSLHEVQNNFEKNRVELYFVQQNNAKYAARVISFYSHYS